MYTRWNDTNHWFEKDTSAQQDGSGPWVELSVDGSQIGQGTLGINIDTSKITTGKLALARGGTGADLSATGGTSKYLRQNSTGSAIDVVQPKLTDLADVIFAQSFTPVLNDTATGNQPAGTTFSARYGAYTLFGINPTQGQLVCAQYSITLNTIGSYSGYPVLGGFPDFMFGNNTVPIGHPITFSGLNTAWCSLSLNGRAGFNDAYIVGVKGAAAATVSTLLASDLKAGSQLIGCLIGLLYA